MKTEKLVADRHSVVNASVRVAEKLFYFLDVFNHCFNHLWVSEVIRRCHKFIIYKFHLALSHHLLNIGAQRSFIDCVFIFGLLF